MNTWPSSQWSTIGADRTGPPCHGKIRHIWKAWQLGVPRPFSLHLELMDVIVACQGCRELVMAGPLLPSSTLWAVLEAA